MSDEPRKPTVPEVLPLVDAYFTIPGNGTGGNLHVALDDGNVEDEVVKWCSREASKHGDRESKFLARVLLQMTETQRREVFERHVYREWDAPRPSEAEARAKFWRIAYKSGWT